MPKAVKRRIDLVQSQGKQVKLKLPEEDENTIEIVAGRTKSQSQAHKEVLKKFKLFDSSSKQNQTLSTDNSSINEQIPISNFFDCKYQPQRLLHREKEMKNIQFFIQEVSYSKNSNQFLMVTGQPGSGKTLLVNHVLDEFEGSIRSARINAMSCKNYANFVNVLNIILMKHVGFCPNTITKLDPKQKMKHLLKNLAQDNLITVLMIDEFETLFQNDDHDAFDLLPLSQSSEYKLKIIGLSNDIDWLQAQTKKLQIQMPQLQNIVFEPYNHKQVESILEQRMIEADTLSDRLCKIDDDALRFCAAQATTVKGGDLRIILDTCKRVLSFKCQKQGVIVITKEDIVQETGNKHLKLTQQLNIQSLSFELQIFLIACYMVMRNNDETSEFNILAINPKIQWIKSCLGLNYQAQSKFQDNLESLVAYNLIEVRDTKINQGRSKINAIMIKLKIQKEEIPFAYADIVVFKSVFSNL